MADLLAHQDSLPLSDHHDSERLAPVLFAGIAWTDRGFDVSLLDERGITAAPLAHFPAGQVPALIDHLRGTGHSPEQRVHCVVESTNGMIDGGMITAGLCVYRADPRVLPDRPAFGSVDAEALARAGVARLPELTQLVLEGGSLTGRLGELAHCKRQSSLATAALTKAGRCLAHGERVKDDKTVALTFDDGPCPPHTSRILNILDRYRVPATFFCVGMHASAYTEELAQMTERGHRLGNHTWSHPFLPDLKWPEIAVQLERTDEILAGAAGLHGPRLFRPPYGSRTPKILARLADEPGGHTVVLWDVEPFDWQLPGADAIARSVLTQVKPGSIVVMHDGGGDRSQTVEALSPIIEGLLARDYRFVRVDELIR
jgi:peptidoglycan/xylan/chitin deacetylase (PgdA/CDA1 family)